MHTCMDVRAYKCVHVQRLSKRYRLVKKSLIHRRIESCDQARWWTSARWGKSLEMGKRMPRLQPYSTTNALISLSLVLLLARYFFYKHTPIGTLNEERLPKAQFLYSFVSSFDFACSFLIFYRQFILLTWYVIFNDLAPEKSSFFLLRLFLSRSRVLTFEQFDTRRFGNLARDRSYEHRFHRDSSIRENLGSILFYKLIIIDVEVCTNCTIAPTHHCTWHGYVATESLSTLHSTIIYYFNINIVNRKDVNNYNNNSNDNNHNSNNNNSRKDNNERIIRGVSGAKRTFQRS